jgi:uroporphyrinogen-III decarboxylase
MNHRSRFFAALDLKEPDYVPITDLGLDSPIVDQILSRERIPPPVFSSSSAHQFWDATLERRLAMVEACVRLDFDAVPVMEDYDAMTRGYVPRFIDRDRFVDQWGRIMQDNAKAKTTYFVGGSVNSPEDLENYEPPDALNPDILEMLDTLVKAADKSGVATFAECHSGWHLAFQVRGGIDKLAIDLYRNSGFASRLLEKLAKAGQDFAKAYIEVGIDVLVVEDDYADNHGPMISPHLFRQYELPNLRRIVEIGKKHGIPVLKHSDGNLYPILDDIVGTGINGLHPIEPGAMDLKGVKESLGGKICIMGNVDCRYVLPYGTEEDVRKDVRRCIDAAAEGGGFVLASSNSIHANVKTDNVYTMVDEARKYGKYPL